MLLEFGVVALFVLEKFHKNVVPNFKVFTAIARRVAVFRARLVSAVDKHFGIRTARTGRTCYPPVVLFRKIEDFFLRNTAFFPYACAKIVSRSVFVACKNGYRKVGNGDVEIVFAR